ncbi:MAG: S26 family signal peptidase [Pseudomonadota bacterium]
MAEQRFSRVRRAQDWPDRGATRSRLRTLASAGAAATILAVAASVFVPPRPRLLWNASASSPVGLYRIGPPKGVTRGDMVVAWAPKAARELAAARRYLPRDVPLIKPVAALAGDRVCARGTRIFLNGRIVALRHARDRAGRRMLWWTGCRRLGRGDLFLLSAGVPGAFDGRYFGITHAGELIGKARLLWRG